VPQGQQSIEEQQEQWSSKFGGGADMGQHHPEDMPPGKVVDCCNVVILKGAFYQWCRRYRFHSEEGKTPDRAVVMFGDKVVVQNTDNSMSKLTDVGWETITPDADRWIGQLGHLANTGEMAGLGVSNQEFNHYFYSNPGERLARFDYNLVETYVGIAAPTAAHSTSVTTGTGPLAQGTYSTFFTFVEADGTESNAGPIVDTVVTLQVSLDLTAIPFGFVPSNQNLHYTGGQYWSYDSIATKYTFHRNDPNNADTVFSAMEFPTELNDQLQLQLFGPQYISATGAELVHTNVPIGPYGTTKRRYYRAYVDSTDAGVRGVIFNTAGELDDNGSVTFTDAVPEDAVGAAYIGGHDEPPTAMVQFIFHRQMCFSFSGNTLSWSQVDLPQYWPAPFFLNVGDDTQINDMVSFRGRLYIFKPNGIWILTGTYCSLTQDATTGFVSIITDFDLVQLEGSNGGVAAWREYGSYYGRCAASCEAGVAWIGVDGLYYTDGTSTIPVMHFEGSGFEPDCFWDVWFHGGKFYWYYNDGTGSPQLIKFNPYAHRTDSPDRYETWGAQWSPLVVPRFERATNMGFVNPAPQTYNGGRMRSFIVGVTDSWEAGHGADTVTIFDNARPFYGDPDEGVPHSENDRYGDVLIEFAPIVAPAPGFFVKPVAAHVLGFWNGADYEYQYDGGEGYGPETGGQMTLDFLQDDGTLWGIESRMTSLSVPSASSWYTDVWPGVEGQTFILIPRVRQRGDVHNFFVHMIGMIWVPYSLPRQSA
jgi:hypothetical protein